SKPANTSNALGKIPMQQLLKWKAYPSHSPKPGCAAGVRERCLPLQWGATTLIAKLGVTRLSIVV
ncbi:MAG: hypothetical protein AAAB35_19130, partial [Phyllobacterium sp.]|uniref:hypothetical protein n=1 Tax=Phyllobacterium sp. TaxID=1871046 RepID=UPI0030F16B45